MHTGAYAKQVAGEAREDSWQIDHYVYDAALHRRWEVLVDCGHPAGPSRMVLLPGFVSAAADRRMSAQRRATSSLGLTSMASGSRTPAARDVIVHADEAITVLSRPGTAAQFALAGVAEQAAYAGQDVRVRLRINGAMVWAKVSGPHTAVLDAPAGRERRKP